MIDIKLMREKPEVVRAGVRAKGIDPKMVDEFLAYDEKWRVLRKELDDLSARQKQLSNERKIEEAKANKESIRIKESELAEAEVKRTATYLLIPNLPLEDVPHGASEADNVVLREIGEKPSFSFAPRSYLDIAEKLGLIDMARGAKVSGSRFGFLLGDAVRLEFALGQLLFETLSDEKIIRTLIKKHSLSLSATPFVPIIPPVIINERSMGGMGYLERGRDEVYKAEKGDAYFTGTSEQSVGAMHQDEILDEGDLPKRYIAFSSCFRREAGSYGKDTKGILRSHQFDKLEMVSVVAPSLSNDEHKLFLAIEEHMMQLLALPYRVINICAADLGDPAAAKYDIEAWMPGQNDGKGEYRETHSTSNTTDFQARRLNIRYRSGDKPEFVHLVNGTGFAIGRTLIAILENYQTEEGNIHVPKALQPYVGKKLIR